MVDLEITNKIPKETCTDWIIYTQILFHLIQNAFKFTQQGGRIKIRVSYHPIKLLARKNYSLESQENEIECAEKTFNIYEETDSLGFLITEVIDNGSGIEKIKFQKLF